jgi:hypothetical protein
MAAPESASRAPRIPKLTYRNHLPPDESSSFSTDPARRPSTTDSLEPCTPISSVSTENRPSSDSRSTTSSTSPSSTSLASSDGSTKKSSKTPKKKKNGMLSFLTMKEPSQLALEQYAEAQRKHAADKGGPAPVGRPGISSQKLPTSVPKVNSKWDGVPEARKSARGSFVSSKRDSSSSHGSQAAPNFNRKLNESVFSVASDGSRGPPNSLASPLGSTIDLDRRRDSGLSESPETPRPSSPSASPQPQITYFFPVSPNAKGPLSTSYADHPWSPPPPPPDMEPEAFPFPEEEPTQAVDSQADAIFRRLKGNGSGFLAGEAQEVRLSEDSDDSDPLPDSHDFLFDLQPLPSDICTTAPAVQALEVLSPPPGPPATDTSKTYERLRGPSPNFSRPRPRPALYGLPHKAGPSSLPTVYEVSIASTDTLASTETITNLHVLTKHSSRDSDDASIASTIPTASEPSTSHHSRSHSSRDRLGLGGTIRKNEISPWESQEQLGKPKKGLRRIF